MANVHYLKRSHNEAVLKIYSTESAGQTIDIDLADLATDNETFDANNAIVNIKTLHWGAKKNKQLDVTRLLSLDPLDTHGHYYLTNTGNHEFVGFVDNTYSDKTIRCVSDGPFHLIIKLTKEAGYTIT